jgi:S1-C subfamily serine protease
VLGIAGQTVPLPRTVIRELRLQASTGVLVSEVAAGSAAHAAGILKGDILVALGGRPAGDVDDLHRLLGEEAIGKPADVVYLRDRRRHLVRLIPQESQRD